MFLAFMFVTLCAHSLADSDYYQHFGRTCRLPKAVDSRFLTNICVYL